MKSLKSPSRIPGLAFWLDASDPTTINDGLATNNSNVYSFSDKVNNIELINQLGAGGPSYSFSAVNGKNAISMPYYSGSDVGQKSLFAVNLPQFQGTNFSMFCVYKPTTTIQDNVNGNQKYVVTLYSKTRWDTLISGFTGPGGFANRAIYIGDEGNNYADTQKRLNPSGRYIEADTTGAVPWQGYITYGENVPSRSGFGPTSLNKTCMTTVRINSNIKKMGFITEDIEFIEDFATSRIFSVSAGILPSLTFDRGHKTSGRVDDLGNQATIVIGSPWQSGKSKVEKLYPLEGFFCEFLYFNRILSDREYHSVSNYLKKKWIK